MPVQHEQCVWSKLTDNFASATLAKPSVKETERNVDTKEDRDRDEGEVEDGSCCCWLT